MSSIRLAWLSLIRRPLSTTLALAAIALAVGGCGVLLRLYQLEQNRFSTIARGSDAIIGAKADGLDILLGALDAEGKYPGFLPYKLFETMQARASVRFEDGADVNQNYLKQVTPFLYCAKAGRFRVVATDSTIFSWPNYSLTFASGRFIDEPDQPGHVVLGAVVARRMNLKIGDTVDLTPWVGNTKTPVPQMGQSFTVSGVLNSTHSSWDRLLFTTIADGQKLIANEPSLSQHSIWGNNVLNYMLVDLPADGYGPIQNLINKRTVGQVVFTRAEKKHLRELTGTGQSIGTMISILVILLGGLAVASMLVARFDAMGVQLAVLRALGYSRFQVALALLSEGFLLGVAACAIGSMIDMATFPMMRWVLGSALPSPDIVSSTIWQSAPVWLAAVLATTASVFLPVIKLYNQDIHTSLRN